MFNFKLEIAVFFLLFFISVLSAQEIIYPFDVEVYYPALKDYKPEKAVSLQELRREQNAKEITKGISLTYNDKGQIINIKTPDKHDWTYTYDDKGRPSKIVVTHARGATETYSYYHRKTNSEWIRRDSDKDHIAEKMIYFYDKRRRIVEEKYYAYDTEFDSFLLDERTVKSFLGPKDERVSAEMNYLYFPEWSNHSAYTSQGKTVYLYHGVTGRLVMKIVSERADNRNSKPLSAQDLAGIRKKEIYSYDDKGRLKEMITTGLDETEVFDKTTYAYAGNNLNEYNLHYFHRSDTDLNVKGDSYYSSRLVFDEAGYPVSHYLNSNTGDGFRASFTRK